MIFVTGYRSFLANKFINLNRNINISKMPQIIKKKKIALLYQDKKKLKNYIRKKNIKHLIHFAGCRKQDSEKSKIFAKKSTYIITKNLVDAINDSNKSIVFIYISTDHVFSGLKKRYILIFRCTLKIQIM